MPVHSLLWNYVGRDADHHRQAVAKLRPKSRQLIDEVAYLMKSMQKFLQLEIPYDAPKTLKDADIVKIKIRVQDHADVELILAERQYLMELWQHTVKPLYAKFSKKYNKAVGPFNETWVHIIEKMNSGILNKDIFETDILQCKHVLDKIHKEFRELQNEHHYLIGGMKNIEEDMWLVLNIKRMKWEKADGSTTIGWDFEFPMPEFMKDVGVEEEQPGPSIQKGKIIDLENDDDEDNIEDDHQAGEDDQMMTDDDETTSDDDDDDMAMDDDETIEENPAGEEDGGAGPDAFGCFSFQLENYVAQEARPIDVAPPPKGGHLADFKVNVYQTGPVTETVESPTTHRIKARSYLAKRKINESKITKPKTNQAEKKETETKDPKAREQKTGKPKPKEPEVRAPKAKEVKLNDMKVTKKKPEPKAKAEGVRKSLRLQKKADEIESMIKTSESGGGTVNATTIFQALSAKLSAAKKIAFKNSAPDPNEVEVQYPELEGFPPLPLISSSYELPSGEKVVELKLLLKPRLLEADEDDKRAAAEKDQAVGRPLLGDNQAVKDLASWSDGTIYYPVSESDKVVAQAAAEIDTADSESEADDDGNAALGGGALGKTGSEPGTPTVSTVEHLAAIREEKEEAQRMRAHFKKLGHGLIDHGVKNVPVKNAPAEVIPVEELEGYEEAKGMDKFAVAANFDAMMKPIKHSISKSAFEHPETGDELHTTQMSALQAAMSQLASYFMVRVGRHPTGFEAASGDEEEAGEEGAGEGEATGEDAGKEGPGERETGGEGSGEKDSGEGESNEEDADEEDPGEMEVGEVEAGEELTDDEDEDDSDDEDDEEGIPEDLLMVMELD
ncbi:hypothetical protein ABW21_db0200618 [Orbilia brochopaga]|nr:hypothetical protein ABW21_db0200618 [Drechslerella brochopaga]